MTVIVRDITRPLPPHPERGICRICGRPHDCKTYHFDLDQDCTVMVSETIWHQLQLLHDNGGFEPVNEVKEPPTQEIIVPTAVARVIPSSL